MIPQTTRMMGSPTDDEIDSEAITVRTPNLPPVVVDEDEAPFPLVRSVRPGDAATSTLRLQPLSLRAPASKQHESAWFEKELPPFVAPGVPEVAEPLGAAIDARHGYTAPSSRGVGFAMVALLLAGVVAAGSFFFLSSRSRTEDAKVPDPTSTTQLTSAEVPSTALAPAPETTTAATPIVKTVRTSDLPEVRADRRKATTPATEPDLRPDDTTKSTTESTVSTPPTPDSTTTPPELESKP